MSYKVFENKNNCCGCSACKSICPKNAISMVADDEGFLYPKTDHALCVECGLCKKVCDFAKDSVKEDLSPAVFAAKADDATRKNSASGGLFALLSEKTLEKGGVVYGAAFDKNVKLCHTRATNKAERDAQRGSKYLQSDMGDCFKAVKQDLESGLYVLFSGTSCQVAGLKSYLSGIDTQKLILVDILCHGTPSPLIFEEYIKFVEKKRGKKVALYHSRAKDKGYIFNERIDYTDGSRDIKTLLAECWSNVFYSNNALRPSCYECKYTGLPRPSDITIADFWGIENIAPDFYDKNGISLVIINSDKGTEFFDEIKDGLSLSDQSFDKAVIKNKNLVVPTKRPLTRERFWQEYRTKGADHIFAYYGGYNIKQKVKRIIKKFI